MNKIYIDTKDNNKIVVRLETENGKFEESLIAHKDKAQNTLPMIEKVLSKAKLKSTDIGEIQVETGPGSFTGLRVGVSIANALAFGTQVKINGKPLGEIVLPDY